MHADGITGHAGLRRQPPREIGRPTDRSGQASHVKHKTTDRPHAGGDRSGTSQEAQTSAMSHHEGRFIWQEVGVLDTYESKALTGTKVMPVFSTS